MTKIYKTPEYKKLVKEIYKKSVIGWGFEKGKETKQQIADAEKFLETGQKSGKLDPKHHSARFKFIVIKNSHKLFFEEFGNDIIMVLAGHKSREWDRILEEESPQIDKQIQKLAENTASGVLE